MLRDEVVQQTRDLPGSTPEEVARKARVEAFEDNELTDEQMEEWFQSSPEEFERGFSDFTSGTWFPMAQQWVGRTCTVGGLIFYTDEVIVGKHCMVYPMYGQFLWMLPSCHQWPLYDIDDAE